MKTTIIKLFFFAFAIQAIAGMYVNETSCPDIEPMKNFDAEKAVGTWYVIESTPWEDEDEDVTCSKEVTTLSDDKSIINSIFTYLDKKTKKLEKEEYISKPKIDMKTGLFMTKAEFAGEMLEYEYMVVDTDYETYSLTWVCQEIKGKMFMVAGIASRQTTMPEELLEKLHKRMDELHMRRDLMKAEKHDDCKDTTNTL